jgi:hypothetical protein
VPAGWMPAPGAHNFAIMPCPAADSKPSAHMGHGSPDHGQDHGKAAGDCFAPLLAGAALPDAAVALAVPVAVVAAVRNSVTQPALGRGPTPPRPPSTGPPSLA